MSDLVAFAKSVKGIIDRANREPAWTAAETERYMEDLGERRSGFLALAHDLMQNVIEPRLHVLASSFPNSSRSDHEADLHCSFWFGYTERFPTSTKLAFTVEHDVRVEKLAVCYEARMVPLFIKFNQDDRLTLALRDASEDKVADWVEQRLAEFLEAYLQIDRGRDDFFDETSTDPVCGMRINRSTAGASTSYCGHPYFFCCAECLAKFSALPQEYVKAKGL